jgi:hypothetical protein
MLKNTLLAFLLLLTTAAAPVAPSFRIAKLHYGGGGDWYANKTSLPNLIQFCNQALKTNIAPEEAVVELDNPELFTYPFIHMTGHGNVVLERIRLNVSNVIPRYDAIYINGIF